MTTTATELHLDISRLEKVRRSGQKVTARCPACHATGNDRRGDHLAILPSGKFACAALPGDGEHRREIFRLVGVFGERTQDPARDREWKLARARDRDEAKAREALVTAARSKRESIINRNGWQPVDVWDDSPQRIDCELVESDPRHFLASLFPSNAIVWTGETHHSGQHGRFADHWRTVAGWQKVGQMGPMVSPATWSQGETSRAAANVLYGPFVVLDFDGFDGMKPATPQELQAHILASLAMIRWIREGLRWQLAAIVWTGGKSLHAWFHSPPPDVLQSLKVTAAALGMDAGLIGRPEHSCRLPGQRHEKTGRMSRVIWLQEPNPIQP